ncbi:MAG: hypothetical protein K0Q59_247 [Paenibacillus sp.]|nr:hypothetical protein [Paenibacillus sp.]
MILSTKISIPYTRPDKLIERPQLTELLDEGKHAKLTIIAAPPGYGKTTALSEWARQCGMPVGWLSLDKYDDDITAFWSYAIAAVRCAYPAFGKETEQLLAESNPEWLASERFVIMLLNEMDALPGDLALLIDDFHMIQSEAIHRSLLYMLVHLPPRIHLYIASRHELSLPVAKLQAKGQLHRVDARDLCFQAEEGIRYFRDCMNLLLTDDDAALLVERAEGWIGGMHLAALSLRRASDRSRFIRNFGGRQRHMADYMQEELIGGHTEETVAWMMRTSIVSRMNGPLCEALTGRKDSWQLVRQLDRQHAFIVKLDDHGEWHRYHLLLSDYLREQLRQRHPGVWEDVHARAARWFEDNGLPEEAMDHLLISRQYGEAIALLEQHMRRWRPKREQLQRWLEQLPESVLAHSPAILLLYIQVLSDCGEPAQAQHKLKAVQAKLDEPLWQPWTAAVLLLASELALYRKDMPRLLESLDRLERHTPQTIQLQLAEGYAWSGMRDKGILDGVNDLHAAESVVRRWIEIGEKQANYPFVNDLYIAYSELMYEWNRLDKAELFTERALKRLAAEPHARLFVSAQLGAARVRHAKGDAAGAVRLVQETKAKLHGRDEPLLAARLDAAALRLASGSLTREAAAAWIESTGWQAFAEPVPLNRIQEYQDGARAFALCGRYGEAMHMLDRLYQLAHREDRQRDKIQALIMQSLTLHQLNDDPHAMIKLEEALHLAQPQGYIRSFVDEGAAMAQLLGMYLHFRQQSFIRQSLPVPLLHVKRLLQLISVHTLGEAAASGLLTAQETRILHFIQQGLMNRQISEKLNVSGETVKMHMKNIYRKLDVGNRMQALQRGKELHLL